MKTRIGFWLLAAAVVYLFGLPLLRATPGAVERNPFALPEPATTPALFVVFVIIVVLVSAGGSGGAARARVPSKDSDERD